ncbi:MAG: winged helix DNA-binding domain-containing protein [Rhodospirillales bacterium]|nr:winged helix DNA-binding domain-containing protein [Rhodospirillales bacterium]
MSTAKGRIVSAQDYLERKVTRENKNFATGSGYYVFPLLEGQRLIGRIDMQRDGDVLRVTGLWLEDGIKMGRNRKAALASELNRYRRFVGASRVDFLPDGLGA